MKERQTVTLDGIAVYSYIGWDNKYPPRFALWLRPRWAENEFVPMTIICGVPDWSAS